MYLTISNYVVSIVLFWHNQINKQRPVYYVSKAIVDVKTCYSQVEQTTSALRIVAKKLHPYFQAYQVTILKNQPLRVTLHKPNLFIQMMKWAIELCKYDILQVLVVS